MNVFIPGVQNANTFFDEITLYTKSSFYYKPFLEFDSLVYDIILIQWPELIFNWVKPTIEDLKSLEYSIKYWKKTTKIIYLVHNIERHYGMNKEFEILYQLIEKNCDVMVHFGEYSEQLFKNKYPNIEHKVIEHPLYEQSFRIYEKVYARDKLGISKDSIVIIAPGAIRNLVERKLVLKAFNKLSIKKKVLIVPNMKKYEFNYGFRGRTKLKPYLDIKKIFEGIANLRKYKKPQYYFEYNFLSSEQLSLLFSASDIVFIPRVKILNSGNIFLGLTYRKIITGPKQGNLTEVLKIFDFPIFDPRNFKSVSKALNKAIQIFKQNSYQHKEELLLLFSPKNLAIKWDKLLEKLVK